MNSTDFSFCGVCKVPLTGIVPAQQHYASDKHKKRVQHNQMAATPGIAVPSPGSASSSTNIPEEGYVVTESRGFCYICMKELTSRVVAEQHLSGKSHRKASAAWDFRKTMNVLAETNIVRTLSSGILNEAISTSPTSVQTPNVNSISTESLTSKCFSFDHDAGEGICLACNEQFSNFPALQKHLKTDDHNRVNDDEWKESHQQMITTSAEQYEQASKTEVGRCTMIDTQ